MVFPLNSEIYKEKESKPVDSRDGAMAYTANIG